MWIDHRRCTFGTAGGGADGGAGGALLEPPADTPTLADYGLDKKRAARDVTFSDIEEEPFERPLTKNTFAQRSFLLSC